MNENLNLVEILKDCPEGTKLYLMTHGDVEFVKVSQEHVIYPIEVKLNNRLVENLTKDGRLFAEYNSECILFPSKEQRDWSKFKIKKPKFDPKTLQPFDKVLGRNQKDQKWKCQLFSNIRKIPKTYPYVCLGYYFRYCIPYNEDTKHLVGTTDEAPEFYRYWED